MTQSLLMCGFIPFSPAYSRICVIWSIPTQLLSASENYRRHNLQYPRSFRGIIVLTLHVCEIPHGYQLLYFNLLSASVTKSCPRSAVIPSEGRLTLGIFLTQAALSFSDLAHSSCEACIYTSATTFYVSVSKIFVMAFLTIIPLHLCSEIVSSML